MEHGEGSKRRERKAKKCKTRSLYLTLCTLLGLIRSAQLTKHSAKHRYLQACNQQVSVPNYKVSAEVLAIKDKRDQALEKVALKTSRGEG